MKKQLVIALVLIVSLALPAATLAFYQLGEINEYISYDRFKIITPLDDKNVYHPRLHGRFINETDEPVNFFVNIYFCDIFKQHHNSVTVSMSLGPKGKSEFEAPLNGPEYERSRDAHHIEFRFVNLVVGGKNKLK